MSAFIKRQPARVIDLGTRPGLNGQTLISTGVAGIDKLLGGGLPLGCLLLIIEDSQSQQHLNLLKCFLAEGLCCKHSLALITAQHCDMESAAAFLPEQAKSSSSTGSSSQAGSGTSASSSRSSASESTAGSAAAADPGDDGLRIAWQYRKYIQNQQQAEGSTQQLDRNGAIRSSSSSKTSTAAGAAALAAGVGREWCHQFDLTKGMSVEALTATRKLQLCCCSTLDQQGQAAVQAAATAAEQFLAPFLPKGPIPVPSRDPASIGRLVLESLGSPDWWPQPQSGDSSSVGDGKSSWGSLEGSMLAAVARIRLAVQDTTCAAVISCPAGLYSDSFQAQLEHLSDVVLCIQSLADDSDIYRLLPDATSASALLEVRRVPELGLLRQRYSEDRLFVIRAKRRSISVGVLDLLPLEASEEAGDGKAGVDKPAVAKICGSGPAGSSVDF